MAGDCSQPGCSPIGRRAPRAATTSRLAGRIVDADGAPLLATHAVNGKARYRYYVSRALHHRESTTGLRIPAREIELLVANRVAALFDDLVALIATAWLEVPAERYPDLVDRCAELAAQLRQRRSDAMALIDEVRVTVDGITVTCATAAIAEALSVSCHPDAAAAIALSHAA